MITKSVIQLLLANTALAAIVGDRIRPNVIKPKETFPAIWVSSYEMQSMPCDNNNGVYSGTIEIGVYAVEYGKCVQILDLVRSTLNNFSGMVDNVGITFQRGQEVADDYDETGTMSIKVIEFEAYAQIK